MTCPLLYCDTLLLYKRRVAFELKTNVAQYTMACRPLNLISKDSLRTSGVMQHKVRFNIRSGNAAEQSESIPLTESLVIGRALTADMVVQDPMSSRQHARFFVKDGFGWVEDLNSSNGSFLNGRRLLEATRISDGDVLSIGQTTFYVDAKITTQTRPLQWTEAVGDVLDRLKQDKNTEAISGVRTSLLLQDRCTTFEQLCAQLLEFVQSQFPVEGVALWISSSQWFGDLKLVSHTYSNIKGLELDWLDRGLEHIIWNEQSIVCGQFGHGTNNLTRMALSSSVSWRTIVPVVWNDRSVGLLLVASITEMRPFISDLVLTVHWYTREWSILEPWSKERSEQVPLVTSMQWMLANETAGLDWDEFQHRHTMLRTVLAFLVQDLGWSAQDIYIAESVMVLVDSGLDSPELTDKLRWFEQSTDPFVRSLVRVAYGVRGQGSANISVRMVRLCIELVEICLIESVDSLDSVFKQLNLNHNLRECTLTMSRLKEIFDLIQQLSQQDQETQLFRR